MSITEKLYKKFEDARDDLTRDGIRAQVTWSQSDEIRTLRIDAESNYSFLQAILYDSGHLNLIVADSATSDTIRDEYRVLSSTDEISELFDLLESLLRARRN